MKQPREGWAQERPIQPFLDLAAEYFFILVAWEGLTIVGGYIVQSVIFTIGEWTDAWTMVKSIIALGMLSMMIAPALGGTSHRRGKHRFYKMFATRDRPMRHTRSSNVGRNTC